jgi:hypothetical protein
MGVLKDFANGFLAMTVSIWMLNAVTLFVLAKTTLAILFLLVLMIPILVLIYQYFRFRQRKGRILSQDGLRQILIFAYGACFACWIFDVGSTFYAIDILGVATEQNPLGWPLGSLGALAFYVPAFAFSSFLLRRRDQRYAFAVALAITALAFYMGIMNLFAGFSNFSFFVQSAVLSLESSWGLLFFAIAIDYVCAIAFFKIAKPTLPSYVKTKLSLSTIALLLGGIALIIALAQPTYNLFIASQKRGQPSFELSNLYVAYTYSYIEIRNNGSATADSVHVDFCFLRRINTSFVDPTPQWAMRATIPEIRNGNTEVLTIPAGRYDFESTFSDTDARDFVAHVSISCIYEQMKIHAIFDLDDFEVAPFQ